jgi:hypothetical protein
MIEYLSAETRILRETEEHLQAGALVFGFWALGFGLSALCFLRSSIEVLSTSTKTKDQSPKTKNQKPNPFAPPVFKCYFIFLHGCN